MSEVWRALERFPRIEISSEGRVRLVKSGHGFRAGHILRTRPNSQGYPRIRQRIDGKNKEVLVHILVCEAFHGPKPTPRHECAHNNGNPLDCSASNLRWATHRENEADKIRHGTANRGERASTAKYSTEVIRAVRNSTERQCDIARRYGMSAAHVCMIKSGQTRAYG